MSLAKLVVTAVKVEGRTKAEVSRTYGVSSRWIYELCRRYDGEGEAGLQPRSRRPNRVRNKTGTALEDEIAELRKELTDLGVDDGAHTIQIHLQRRHQGKSVPSVATIWRVLSRRGFVTPEPQKRPRSSYTRFEAAQPNERWQETSPTAPGRRDRRRDLGLVRRPLEVPLRLGGQVRVQGGRRRELVPGIRCGPRSARDPAHRQRCRLHRSSQGWALHDGARDSPMGREVHPVEALSPPDLRQGREAPLDPQALPLQAGSGRIGEGAPG